MTSSSEGVVIRGEIAGQATPLSTPELRNGAWTRLGGAALRGDAVTESTLASLADRTRAAAHAEGYAVGWAKGMREAEAVAARTRAEQEELLARTEARREAQHQAAVAALTDAARRLEELAGATCARLEEQATELAWAVTAEVLGHQSAQDGPEDVVRRVLAVLPEGPVALVRVHPEVARSVAAADLPAGVQVSPDPSLDRADALVELADHVIDLRIDRALARVREVLA